MTDKELFNARQRDIEKEIATDYAMMRRVHKDAARLSLEIELISMNIRRRAGDDKYFAVTDALRALKDALAETLPPDLH